MLAQLPDAEYEALAKFLVPVDLPLGKKLSDPNQPIEYVYFLNTGLISTDAMTEKGETVPLELRGVYKAPPFYPLLGEVSISLPFFDKLYERPQNLYTFLDVKGGPSASALRSCA